MMQYLIAGELFSIFMLAFTAAVRSCMVGHRPWRLYFTTIMFVVAWPLWLAGLILIVINSSTTRQQ